MFRLKTGGADAAARSEIVDYEVVQPFRKNPAIMRMLLFLIFVYLLILHILSIEQMRTVLRNDSPPRIVYYHPAKLHFYIVPEINQATDTHEDLSPAQLCAFIDAVQNVQPEESHVYGFAVRLNGPLWNEAARWGAQWHSLNFTANANDDTSQHGDTKVHLKTLASVHSNYYNLMIGTSSDEEKFAFTRIVPNTENSLLAEEESEINFTNDRRESTQINPDFQSLPHPPHHQRTNRLFHQQRRRLTLAKLQNLLSHGGVHVDCDTSILNSTLLRRWQSQSSCLMSISWHGSGPAVAFSNNSGNDASVALPFISCPQNSPYISSMLSRYTNALNFASLNHGLERRYDVGKSADRFLYRVAHSHLPYTATLLREVPVTTTVEPANGETSKAHQLALLYVPRSAFSEHERQKLRTLYTMRASTANFENQNFLFSTITSNSSDRANRQPTPLSVSVLNDFLFVYRLPTTSRVTSEIVGDLYAQKTTRQKKAVPLKQFEFSDYFKRRHWKYLERLNSCKKQIVHNKYCG